VIPSRPLKIAVIAGEESGDLLGADLVAAIGAATGKYADLIGVGGHHLGAMGLVPLFDSAQIALMGVSAIVRDLPGLMRRIRQTADAIIAANPDCLVTVDSPEFSLRVARRVREARPRIPIVHYVCPSVWAWRPGRAPAMRPYVDHVLCLLPFEPAELDRLGGPPGTFVGHRLSSEPGVVAAAAAQAARGVSNPGAPRKLLVLPGSRRSEVRGLLGDFAQTMAQLRARGHRLDLVLPTVPNVAAMVADMTSEWTEKPRIVLDPAEKWKAFGDADAALIASGTVSLELALCGVPMVSCYRTDMLARLLHRLITVWSAVLPNIIADRPVVPEFYNEFVRPENLARQIEAIAFDTPMRAWQRSGFEEVRRRLHTERPAREIAADVVLEKIAARRWE
jgi:lipid-A-disaccharide synthase